MANLVTGEAVELDLPYAKLATRGVAFGIDVLLQGTVLLTLFAFVLVPAEVDTALLTALTLLVAVGVLVGYPTIMETLAGGRTLGKLAMGLRVVREDGGPVSFRHALVRALGGFFVDFWALGLSGCVAIVVSLASQRGKRVGDFLAGTVVVRTRAARQDATAVAMPPYLAEWAAQLDVSAIPDRLALALRQYVGRLPTLNAAARQQLGDRLAADVSQHLSTPIPQGPRAPEFLAAVLAERRRREAHRFHPAAATPGSPAGAHHGAPATPAGDTGPWAGATPAPTSPPAAAHSPGVPADPPDTPPAPGAATGTALPGGVPTTADSDVATPPNGMPAGTAADATVARSSEQPFAPPE